MGLALLAIGLELTGGASARLRYESVQNSDWGRDPSDPSGYEMWRVMLDADLRVGDAFRTYLEVQSALTTDRNGGPRPTDKDEIDLHQAFVELSASGLHLRAGRQELAFGSSRLVSVREGTNVRRAFDGARLFGDLWGIRADAFLVAPVETNPGVFDDGDETRQVFWGTYATGKIAPPLHVDLYYLGWKRPDAAFEQGKAREIRHSVGARFWGAGAGVDHDTELVYQFGAFGSESIRAWTVASNTGYTAATLPAQPRLGLKANVTSGDTDPRDRELNTFNPLFPRGSYFGEASLIGPLNHVDLDPGITFHPRQGLAIELDGDFFWRESLSDGLYRVSGGLQVAGANNPARFVGVQTSVTIQWELDRRLSLLGAYAHFFPGPFLSDAGLGRGVDFVTIQIVVRTTPRSDG